jgi:hypothetical protein
MNIIPTQNLDQIDESHTQLETVRSQSSLMKQIQNSYKSNPQTFQPMRVPHLFDQPKDLSFGSVQEQNIFQPQNASLESTDYKKSYNTSSRE